MKRTNLSIFPLLLLSFMLFGFAVPTSGAEEPIDISSRLELLVDHYLIDSMNGAELLLHHPAPHELAIVYDRPWEGTGTGYVTIFKDDDLYRMYYKAWQLTPTPKKLLTPHETFGAYAESRDGRHWIRPKLDLFEFEGSKQNNIVWVGPGSHDFTPFRDKNPNCKPEEKYKAVGYGKKSELWAFTSADGIHWKPIAENPIMTGCVFDTQNLVFWDTVRGEYRAYVRDFNKGRRDIKTATSNDFVHWTTPTWIKYPGAPDEQLYTNQVIPYYRAPHVFLGFPTRYTERGWSSSMEALPEPEHRHLRSKGSMRYGTALTDGLFMSSRDGKNFHRWGEAFIRPGARSKDNWKYGDNYQAWGLVETKSDIPGAPDEISIYATEGYWIGKGSQLRRFTIRVDGFVSAHAPLRGGEFVTKPLLFKGKNLVFNVSTSAGGSIRVELQQADGTPIEGYRLADCPEIFGDSLQYIISWKQGTDVSPLAGKPIRMRVVLKDADLYSFRFQ